MKSKPRFLQCFRPMVDMDMLESKRVRRVRSVEKEDHPPLTKTMSLDSGFCSSLDSDKWKMPPPPNRSFSRVVKAVVFETILAKRARDLKGYRQDSFGSSSKRSFSMRSEASIDELVKIEENFEEKIKPNLEKTHSRSSSNTSSSSTSMSRSSSGSESKRLLPKPLSRSDSFSESKRLPKTSSDPTKQIIRRSNQDSAASFNSGLYVLLISLGITVFCGRVFAILVTSIWFYLYPGSQTASKNRSENAPRKWSEAEWRDNKKKVIMEGLIERRSHHGHSHRHRDIRDFRDRGH